MAEQREPDIFDRLLARAGIGARPPQASPRLPGLFERPSATESLELDEILTTSREAAQTAALPTVVGQPVPPPDPFTGEPRVGRVGVAPPVPPRQGPADPGSPASVPVGPTTERTSALHEMLRVVHERLVTAPPLAASTTGAEPRAELETTLPSALSQRPGAAAPDGQTVRAVPRTEPGRSPQERRRSRLERPEVPTVHVSIGRLEVTAATRKRDPEADRRPRPRPALDLAEFLTERDSARP